MHYNIKSILNSNGFDALNTNKKLYINLYEALKNAILNKSLQQNTKLPPTRILANDLKISRSTVVKTYDLLLIDKYITSKKGSGYYVVDVRDKKIHSSINTNIKVGAYPEISKKGKAFIQNIYIKKNEPSKGVAFRPGLPPLDIFPINQWKSLQTNYWNEVKNAELSYANAIGLKSLRLNIANYLKVYRNITCNPDQIVITTGSLHSLYLIANSLINENDSVVLENPTYPRAYNLFKSLQAKIHSVNIDDEGIVIKKIKCKSPKLIYTTPSNQYPLGVKMSLKRRRELLQLASKKSTFIIEDDYDHEFSNWEKPIASIYSLDKQERVIYLGTFNKLLFPSVRLAYMIVPPYLLDAVLAIYNQSSRFVSPSRQKTMSAFIEKDYLNKHLRNVIEVCQQRKAHFTEKFNDIFSTKFKLEDKPLGLHLIAESNEPIDDFALTHDLLKNNVVAHPYSNYFIKNKKSTGMVMGYASVNEKNISEKLDEMAVTMNTFFK